jgi:sialate O-acetylesterase
MVFPANKPFGVYGEGKGKVTVKFKNITKELSSNDEKWYIEFPSMTYGGPYTMEIDMAGEIITLNDIYVGEVYLYSGQSNMVDPLHEIIIGDDVYEDNDYLRYVDIKRDKEELLWHSARRDNVGDWSALAYLSGRRIAKEKGVHVGIILCAECATVIESWMPEGALSRIGIDIPIEEKYRDHTVYSEVSSDSLMYNEKLKRVIPMSISGVVWYQGESDASEAEGLVYERELEELIKIWREAFGSRDLPFVIVQIADCESRLALGRGWRMIQEAQKRISLHVPRTYTVISRDVCERDAIHPRHKGELAERIAETVKGEFFK